MVYSSLNRVNSFDHDDGLRKWYDDDDEWEVVEVEGGVEEPNCPIREV